MKLKIRILFLLCLVLVQTGSAGWCAGTNAASFLKIKASGRSAAMSDALTAAGDGASSIESNPAGMIDLLDSNEHQLLAAHNEWFQGIRSEFLNYARPLGDNYAVGTAIKVMYVNDLVRRDKSDQESGSFGISYRAFTVGAAAGLGDQGAAGANVKILQEVIDSETGTSYAFDFGALYSFSKYFDAGFTIQNAGNALKVQDQQFSLPFTTTLGLAYFPFESTTVGLDLEKENGYSPLLKLGVEQVVFDVLALRGGYSYTQDERVASDFTMGLGIFLGKFSFDYGYVSYGDLGLTHRFSITFSWGHSSS